MTSNVKMSEININMKKKSEPLSSATVVLTNDSLAAINVKRMNVRCIAMTLPAILYC